MKNKWDFITTIYLVFVALLLAITIVFIFLEKNNAHKHCTSCGYPLYCNTCGELQE